MVVLIVLAIIFIIVVVSQKKSISSAEKQEKKFSPAAQQRLYSTVYDHKHVRPTLDRETVLWECSLPFEKLQEIHQHILNRLRLLRPNDWESIVASVISRRSPDLSMYVTDDGGLDIESAREQEMSGIKDAIEAVENTNVGSHFTLRSYFHKVFENIVEDTKLDNKYYSIGQLKVIEVLQTYQASLREFAKPILVRNKDVKKSSQGVFAKLASHYDSLEKLRLRYHFNVNRGNPIIEFDLEKIVRSGNLAYQGSPFNCLFLKLVQLLKTMTNGEEPEMWVVTGNTYDAKFIGWPYDVGTIWLVKYTGAVDYFPHRLYIEFENIAPNETIIRDLRCYKLHLEGND